MRQLGLVGNVCLIISATLNIVYGVWTQEKVIVKTCSILCSNISSSWRQSISDSPIVKQGIICTIWWENVHLRVVQTWMRGITWVPLWADWDATIKRIARILCSLLVHVILVSQTCDECLSAHVIAHLLLLLNMGSFYHIHSLIACMALTDRLLSRLVKLFESVFPWWVVILLIFD